MDLDFSFALVSSLTPRSQTSLTPRTDNKNATKTLKIKHNKTSPTKSNVKNSFKISLEEKENILYEEELMHNNECHELVKNNGRNSDEGTISTNESLSFNMANIAVRKNKTRGRTKSKSNLLSSDDNVIKSKSHLTYEGFPNLSTIKTEMYNTSSNVDGLMNDSALGKKPLVTYDDCHNVNISKKGVKRKSPQLNSLNDTSISVDSSLDLVESPCFTKTCNDDGKNSVTKDSYFLRPNVKSLSETSISTAYDSDSFQPVRRHRAKVIPETSDSDESFKTGSNVLINSLNAIKERTSSDSSIAEIKEIIKKKTFDGITRNTSSPTISVSSKSLSASHGRKMSRPSNESAVTNIFKLESSIKKQEPTNKESQATMNNNIINCTKKDKSENNTIFTLKENILKETLNTNINSIKKEKLKSKAIEDGSINNGLECENVCKENLNFNYKNISQNGNSKNVNCSSRDLTSPQFKLVPPSEVIPKFEHIKNWLKNTEDKANISLSNNASMDPHKKRGRPVKLKHKISLSPRIKNKKIIAHKTLQEEQKLFEELFSNEEAKRLSDDVDEVISISSSRESVEISENVLEKLYGTVCQKNPLLPQSEPRKKLKKTSSKKKAPRTERKKPRTSIYDVFSSSSSEDRFEEFLESVKRGKVKSSRQNGDCPDSPEFINDFDSDSDTSIAFYHNIVSSAVKEEVELLRKTTRSKKSPVKPNRRRLSFGSSKDDCSESGKSDDRTTAKGKKPSTKGRKTSPEKTRSKKKNDEDVDENFIKSLSGFTLVTPIKIKDRKTNKNSKARINAISEPEVPRSVGKSKTPKNPTKHLDDPDTEEKSKTIYGDNFKVPKAVSLLKTPTNLIRKEVPSSPALSFLSSLSESTGGLPCHPDALIYKKDFKKKREELTKKLFSLYNKEVFENKLPEDMLIQWNIRMTSTSGYCYNKRIYSKNEIHRSSRIVLSTKILDRADRLRDTLIHELCHAATWIVNGTSDGHGPNWRAWADKANRRFPELPVIKRCHDYAINTKFTYKCMSCGYCIGRHTKSLDTDRKRCGYCFGKFQVFVTAKMSTTSGSDSAKKTRNPTGFALFVKENYALIKKENNNIPHGEVMKLLSQKFAEIKITKQNTNADASIK